MEMPKKKNLWIYNKEKHDKNVKKLKELFFDLIHSFNSIKFDIKSSENIDEDLYFMYRAKHFVDDFGGFSKLIKELKQSFETKNVNFIEPK